MPVYFLDLIVDVTGSLGVFGSGLAYAVHRWCGTWIVADLPLVVRRPSTNRSSMDFSARNKSWILLCLSMAISNVVLLAV